MNPSLSELDHHVEALLAKRRHLLSSQQQTEEFLVELGDDLKGDHGFVPSPPKGNIGNNEYQSLVDNSKQIRQCRQQELLLQKRIEDIQVEVKSKTTKLREQQRWENQRIVLLLLWLIILSIPVVLILASQ